jgi:hypothetical protein
MNLEKVIFAFFSILALTLNFGFFIGELDDPAHHNGYELFAALVVSLIGGALLANLTSVILLVVETVTFRR